MSPLVTSLGMREGAQLARAQAHAIPGSSHRKDKILSKGFDPHVEYVIGL